jgi:hypothetical protein
MKYSVILNPALDNRNSPYGFSAPKPKPPTKASGGKNRVDEVELLNVFFTPGTNFIDAEEWEVLQKHPPTKGELDRCMRRGVVQLKVPTIADGSNATDTTADYAEIDDVKDIIFNSHDIDWLRRSMAKDSRPQVDQICSERITEIEQSKKKA